ncbi:hypothetical protein SFRURICE_018925 [Spodoptera frugiperda]|nr:hypothetical protein SFRURICE_018925 [Spodoptera frugiperda]
MVPKLAAVTAKFETLFHGSPDGKKYQRRYKFKGYWGIGDCEDWQGGGGITPLVTSFTQRKRCFTSVFCAAVGIISIESAISCRSLALPPNNIIKLWE